MSILNLNDLPNQLRVPGKYDVVFWPRYSVDDNERRRNEAYVVWAAIASVLVAATLETFRFYLLTPIGLLLIVADVIKRINRKYFGIKTSIGLGEQDFLVAAPFTSTWVICVVAPFTCFCMYPSLWEVCLLTLISCVCLAFVHRITLHYCWYLTTDHRLSESTQEKWQSAFRRLAIAFPNVRPRFGHLNPNDRKLFERALAQFRGFRTRLLIASLGFWLITAPFWLFPNWLSDQYCVFALLSFVASLSFASAIDFFTGRSSWKQSWIAVQNYISWPKFINGDEYVPWSPDIQFRGRRDNFLYSLILVTSLTAPIAGFAALHSIALQNEKSVATTDSHEMLRTPAAITALVRPDGNTTMKGVFWLVMSGGGSAGLSLSLLFSLLHFVAGPTLLYSKRILEDGD